MLVYSVVNESQLGELKAYFLNPLSLGECKVGWLGDVEILFFISNV